MDGLNGAEVNAVGDRRNRWDRQTLPEPTSARAHDLELIRTAVRHEMERHRDSLVTWLVIACAAATVGFAVAFAFALWGPGGK